MKTINPNFEIIQTITATAEALVFQSKKKEVEKDGKKKKVVDFDDDGNAKIDITRVQVAAFVEDPKTKLDKKESFTLHLDKELTDEELKNMRYKTFEFGDVKEYAHKNGDFTTYTYSASKIIKEVKDVEDVIFVNNKSVTAIVNKIAIKDKDTIFQIRIEDGMRIAVKNIKLKDNNSEELLKLKGKKLRFDGLKVTKMDINTYYSTINLPKVI